jgi:hypothetical protein
MLNIRQEDCKHSQTDPFQREARFDPHL